MPMDTYPKQPQIGSKSADLHMPGSSARERGPSKPATVGPIFNELPRHAPEPQHMAHNLNYPVGRSAYNDRRSAYNHERSGPMSGQSAHDLFEEDCYLNPHPSQQHFPSHYAMHQPINTKSRAQKAFRPRLEGRKGSINPMSHIGQMAMHHIAQTNGGEDNMPISSQPHLCLTRESVVSHQLPLI
jgi:hypothetical protein